MKFGLSMVLIVALPSVSMFFGATSLSAATFALCLGLITYARSIYPLQLLILMFVATLSILVLLSMEYIDNVVKRLTYLNVILISILAGNGYRRFVNESLNDRSFVIVNVFWGLFILSVVSSYAGLGASLFSIPMFPFIEPSHFFIYLSYLALPVALTTIRQATFITGSLFTIAILLPSLTGVVLAFWIGLLACIKHFRNPFIIIIPLIMMAVGFELFISDQEYFSSRLELNVESTNLSSLALLQGYEAILLQLQSGAFFGSGVGGTDLSSLDLEYRHIIYSLSGSSISLSDGGFLAVRLILDFGFVGLLAVCWILFKSLIFVFKIREIDGFTSLFILSPLAIFPIELLFRSPGLISPSLIFVLAALGYSYRKPRPKSV